jgi:glycosyltransferase involved in cell wall biosynthesis
MWESISFGRHVCRYLARQKDNVDVLYANTWPLFSQELIARHCARRGIPVVLHVQDIYPEALESKLPQWLGRCVIPVLRQWDRRIAHLAAKVVVVAEEARRTYAKTRFLPDERVELVHNWQDERLFLSAPSRAVAAQEWQVNGTAFNFLYLGNIGPTTDMELAIRGFARASIQGSQLLIIGAGAAKQACVALTQELGVPGVRFLPCASASDAPTIQALADVCLLPLKRGVALNGVPSKLAAYLFSAKPVLAMLDTGSDTARFILEAKCGWVGEPGNANWLSAKMEEVASLPPGILESMGQCGRAYALDRFSRAEGVKRLGGLLLATSGYGCGPAHSLVPPRMPSVRLGALR